MFTSQSVCSISNYQLYANVGDADVHPAFEPFEELALERRIRFKVKEEFKDQLGTYTFHLKVTADGGDEFWVGEEQFTFEVLCGPGSTSMTAPAIPLETFYTIDDAQPSFSIPEVDTRSSQCHVQSYQVMIDKEADTLHPDFDYDYIVADGQVTFKVRESFAKVKADYHFYVKVSAQGGGVNWANGLRYSLSVGCGMGSTVVEASSDT